MTMNSSGPISLAGTTTGQSIEIELGGSGTTQISLNDTNVRTLAGVASGAITMPTNFYGKSNTTYFMGIVSTADYYTHSLNFYGLQVDSSGNFYILTTNPNSSSVTQTSFAKFSIAGTYISQIGIGSYSSGSIGSAYFDGTYFYIVVLSISSSFFNIIKMDTSGTVSLSRGIQINQNPYHSFSITYPQYQPIVTLPNGKIVFTATGYYQLGPYYNCCYPCGYYTANYENLVSVVNSTVTCSAQFTVSAGCCHVIQATVFTFDSSSNIYVAGFSGTGCYGLFVAEISSGGGLPWHRYFTSAGQYPTCIRYQTGYNSVIVCAGPYIYNVSTSNGAINWSLQLPTSGNAWSANTLDFDSSGNIYVAGQYNGGNNNQYFIIFKVSPTGTVQWQNALQIQPPGTGYYGGTVQIPTVKVYGTNLILACRTVNNTAGYNPVVFYAVLPTDGSHNTAGSKTVSVNGYTYTFNYASSSYSFSSAPTTQTTNGIFGANYCTPTFSTITAPSYASRSLVNGITSI